MGLEDFRDSVSEEIQGITSSDFEVVITETDVVPEVNDPNITYPNLVVKQQKCKLIETCVLYIDIRKSTDLSFSHKRSTLTKLYSSFTRVMARCGGYYGGKVRGIVGDRLMVIFDKEACFTNAVNTAILMNSVSKYLLDKHFIHDEVKCGIGIDYGKMLASKVGIIKQGVENTANKSLVWLGRPANIASKLTDQANRTTTTARSVVHEGYYYRNIDKWSWYDTEMPDFLGKLEKTHSPVLKHPDKHFNSFFLSTKWDQKSASPILMTKSVFDGFVKTNPNDKSVKGNWWYSQDVSVAGYGDTVYGGDVIFTMFRDT